MHPMAGGKRFVVRSLWPAIGSNQEAAATVRQNGERIKASLARPYD
jgi:hypothetical protein